MPPALLEPTGGTPGTPSLSSRQGEHRTALGDASDHDPGWDEGLIGRIGAINLWFGDLVRAAGCTDAVPVGIVVVGVALTAWGFRIAVEHHSTAVVTKAMATAMIVEDQDSAALIFCLLMWRDGHLWAAPLREMC
ncbi:MAG: hypothetical protein R2709_10865 [Marmoricola sp.]